MNENIFAILVLILSLATLGMLIFNDDGCNKTEEQVMLEEAERVVED